MIEFVNTLTDSRKIRKLSGSHLGSYLRLSAGCDTCYAQGFDEERRSK